MGIHEELGKHIKDVRKSRKITQKQLADMIGKTTSSIQKYESGEQQPPLSVIEQIAAALSISVSDLADLKPVGFDTPLEFEKEWIKLGGGQHTGRIADLARIELNEEQLNDAGINELANHSDLLVKSGQYKKE